MPWAVEQNTGVNERGVRCIYFNGSLFATTQAGGVWQRDGVGPWTQVFAGGGYAWEWDGQLWCGGPPAASQQIWRSSDGVAWVQDIDLNVTFGVQGFYQNRSEIGGRGAYLYVANHDVGGAGATYFYRRDTNGVWDMPLPVIAGTEGANGRGVLPFGPYVYFTSSTRVRRWSASEGWIAEPTIDGLCAGSSYISLIGNRIFVGTSASITPGGGYYVRAIGGNWELIRMEAPDNTWTVYALSIGGDGSAYTFSTDGAIVCVYRLTADDILDRIVIDSPGLAMSISAVGVEADGTMYWAARAAAVLQFFAFAPDYNVSISAGLNPLAMDCDGDGRILWMGLGDAAGQPVLIRAALPLGADTMGSAIYQPGAGDAINVKCSNVGNRLVVSGYFGNNEQVRYTEDGIVTVDMDPGTWGVDRAQPLLLDPDGVEEVMIALATAQELWETFDQGASPWIQENAAVGYSPSAMARLADGHEMILGDGAANMVSYSPNRGVSLNDITDSFLGNVAALEVI